MSNAATVEAVLFAALEKPTTAERTAFLNSACAGDAELRRQVEKLLKAHANVGDFLQKPVAAPTDSRDTPEVGNARGPEDTTDHTPDSSVSGCADTPAHAQDVAAPAITVPGYEVEGVLGRGGMGVVYKARHLALKRTVALKMILAGGHAGPHELARFRLETEAAARLQHPNIVQIHEVGEADGHPYCALEFVEGGNLASRIGGKPIPPGAAAKLVETLAQAMHLAHSRNVVHRDLKPANILLAGASGQGPGASEGKGAASSLATDHWPLTTVPKITDFGLARHMDSDSGQTQAGQVMGSPSYMAPEQASGRGHEAGPPADVYALGAILYHCLAGRPPFQGRTMVETLDLVRTQEPAPPSRHQAGVPPDLETICLKCLRKEPEQRYASAAELADDLVRYQQGEPIRARPVGRLERAVKLVKRNPVVTGAAVAAVLALVAGTTVSTLNYLEADAALHDRDRALSKANEALDSEARRVKERDTALDAEKKEHTRANTARADAEREADSARKEARRANTALHALQIDQGLQARQKQDHFRVGKLLTEMRPEFHQAWETRYVRNLWLKEAWPHRILVGHDGAVLCVCFSPDSNTVLTGGADKTARLWDAHTGVEKAVLTGHTSDITSACFSPDGKTILTGSQDNTARLWDAQTGKEKARLEGHKDHIMSACFSGDGDRVLTGAQDGTARLWDAATGEQKVVFRGHSGSVVIACFSPDAKTVLTGSGIVFTPSGTLSHRGGDGTARLWEAATGKQKLILTPDTPEKPKKDDSGHRGSVVSVSFSRDGEYILTGGGRTARVWHADTGKEKVTFEAPNEVWGAYFSPDGKRVVTVAVEFPVRLWDVATGQQKAVLEVRRKGRLGYALNACFSPDGKRILIGGNPRLGTGGWLWDPETGQEQAITGSQTSVYYSPDGRYILTGNNDSTAQMWDVQTAEERVTLAGHLTKAQAVSLSSDGKLVLAVADTMRLLDARTGQVKVAFAGRTGGVNFAALSPDGKRVITSGNPLTGGGAKLWDAETGQPIKGALKGQPGGIRCACFSPDGKRLLTGSGVVQRVLGDGAVPMIDVGSNNTARLWDAATGNELAKLVGHPGEITSVSFSPDGKTALTAGAGVRLWDAVTGKQKFVLEGGVAACFSGDGKIVFAATDRSGLLCDAHTGNELAVLDFGRFTDSVVSAALSPDGSRVLTGSKDHTARLWDARTGEVKAVLKGHANWVECVAFSPDGQRAFTGGRGDAARLWDVETGLEMTVLQGPAMRMAFSSDGQRLLVWHAWTPGARLWDAPTGPETAVLKGHEGTVSAVAFSPGGKTALTGGHDGTARLWDARTGREKLVIKGHTNGVTSVSFSPDGTKILTGSSDQTARLWDADTGKELAKLVGHTGPISGVTFSHDGQRLLTGCEDNTARLWDPDTGKELARLEGHADRLTSVCFSPDGNTILTGSHDGTARLWNAHTGKEKAKLDGDTGPVMSVSFSRDGQSILTGSLDSTARVWDAKTGKQKAVCKGPTGGIVSTCLSPDGKHIVAASGNWTRPDKSGMYQESGVLPYPNRMARLWDATSGQEVATLTGHTLLLTSVAFSPDGKTVLTGSRDGTARLWDAQPRR